KNAADTRFVPGVPNRNRASKARGEFKCKRQRIRSGSGGSKLLRHSLMAGYIFGLDNLNSLLLYTRHGAYGTKLSPPSTSWMAHHEGTFADYATMKVGDNIYFFIQRIIYVIG